MKVLKSGIEMTPKELKETKAGKTCACGCQGPYVSGDMWVLASEETGCMCGCAGSLMVSPGRSAYTYPW